MRRYFTTKVGLLSMENASQALAPNVAGANDGSADALAVVNAEVEAGDAEADVAFAEGDMEAGLEATVALESLRETIWQANQNGGLDRHGARIAKQHADFVLKQFLKSDTGMVMPTLESFGGAGSRVQSGVLTMESVSSTLKSVWDAIMKQLNKVKTYIMDWFNKIFGNAEKLIKRADAIYKRATDIKSSKKEATFEDDAVFEALAVNNELKAASFKAGLEGVVKLSDQSIEMSVAINSQVDDVVDALEGIGKDVAAAATKMAEVHKLPFFTSDAGKKSSLSDGLELPGNVKLKNGAQVDVGKASERFEVLSLASNGAKAKPGSKIETLDTAAIQSIATMVKNIAEALITVRKVEPASKKAYDKLAKFVKEQTAESGLKDKAVDNDVKTDYSDRIKATKNMLGAINGPIKAVGGYCLKTARSALDYCDKSLAQY